MSESGTPRIVIVGAGFAGLSALQRLVGVGINRCADIVLVDKNNYHTFIPLIYQVATGFISPDIVAYPIRRLLRSYRSVRFQQGTVSHVDFVSHFLHLEGKSISYDYLILATGSQTTFLNVAGAPTHSFPLRSLDDAVTVHQHILQCVNEATRYPEARDRLLTFVIVGGGPTGVEMAGALIELLDRLIRDTPELNRTPPRVLLAQSGDRLLKGFPEALGRHTLRQLRQRGV